MTIGAVVELSNRLIQLANYRKQSRRELLADVVAPVFEAFEAVHAQYLESFASYRAALRATTEPLTLSHPLIDTIRTDNLFTEHARVRILNLGSAPAEPRLGVLMRLIRDYLLDIRVAAKPAGGYRGKRFANPQHWRRTLLDELEAIFDEQWQVVLDPNNAQPPLYGDELERALRTIREEERIAEVDPRKLDKLKQLFAIRALDDVVGDMQDAYGGIVREYAELQAELIK